MISAILHFGIYQFTFTLVGGTTLSTCDGGFKLADISGFGGDLMDSAVVAASS